MQQRRDLLLSASVERAQRFKASRYGIWLGLALLLALLPLVRATLVRPWTPA